MRRELESDLKRRHDCGKYSGNGISDVSMYFEK